MCTFHLTDETRSTVCYTNHSGATGFDGSHDCQVACRGAVTTLKGSTKHKRQHRTGTRSLIKLCASLRMPVAQNKRRQAGWPEGVSLDLQVRLRGIG